MVDVEAFALHNAFEINHPDAMTGVVGLVNIGHDVTNINILDEGVPILTRDITVGTRRFREDLQRERGLGADEAQPLLQGYDRSPHLDAVLESRGEEIAVGIERAAAFLASLVASGSHARDLHVRRRRAHSRASTRRSPTGCASRVQQANPLANLKVRDGALEVARHRRNRAAADAADRAGAPAGRMIRDQSSPGRAARSTTSRQAAVDLSAFACRLFADMFRDRFLIGARRAVVLGLGAVGYLYFVADAARSPTLEAHRDKAVRRLDALRQFPQGSLARRGGARHAAAPGEHHQEPRRRPLRLAARDGRGQPRAAAVHVAHDDRVHRHAAGHRPTSSRRRRRPTRRRPRRRRPRAPKRLDTDVPRDPIARPRLRPHGRHPGADALHEGSRSVAVPHERAARQVRARARDEQGSHAVPADDRLQPARYDGSFAARRSPCR